MTTVLDTTQQAGCSHRPTMPPRAQPITVNGVAIPRDAIARETQNHPAGRPIDAWMAAARALVVRELLLQEARRLDLDAQPLADAEGRRETHEEASIRSLVDREVIVPKADEATCRRIYDRQHSEFRSPDIHEVRHILIAAVGSDAAARTCARARAEALIAEITASPGQFAALARTESACPSAQTGGHLGQIVAGQTVPELEAALPGLPVGVVAPEPVATRYGYHVVIVDRRIEGALLPFECVASDIAAWLEARAQRRAVHQYIGHLAGRADIRGVTLDGSGASTQKEG